MEFELSPEEIAQLYSDKIFLVHEPESDSIAWKLRKDSKVIFILHESEFNNKALTELLKKIVQYAELAKDSAGFGVIKSRPTETDFQNLPANLAIVFDDTLSDGNNPMEFDEKKIWFSKRLSQLKDSVEDKKLLQGYLNQIKSLLK